MQELTKDDLLTMIATLSEENKGLRLQALELQVRLGNANREVHQGEVVEPDSVVSDA